VVVNALRGSPWGAFTIAATMPIAVFMGIYLRYWRPGKVLECSLIGLLLVAAAIIAGRTVAESATLAPWFTLGGMTLALAIVVYGFFASALPVWLLLAPRDYLSTFVKLGVVTMLAAGVLFVRPELQLPAFTRFTDGSGPIFAGKIFPFCFITIACGAVSGFHSLIASGTTPKMIARESHARPVGYGAMLLEFRRLDGYDRGRRAVSGRLLRRELPGRRGGGSAGGGRGHRQRMGLSGKRRGDDHAGARCRRAQPLLAHRGSALAGAGHGAHLRAHEWRSGPARLLVSLRHHVRGAVHSDDHRRRHARGALPVAGPARPGFEAPGDARAGCRA
jgi:hypothetical protein